MGTLTINNADCRAFANITLGLLYNWPTVDDARNITSDNNWVIPDRDSVRLLAEEVEPGFNDSVNVIGKRLKATGTQYWTSGGGLDTVSFAARGSGTRSYIDGAFNGISDSYRFWRSESNTTNGFMQSISDGSDIMSIPSSFGGGDTGTSIDKKSGNSIRLVNPSTTLSDGETGFYIGNDGKKYHTLCIGTEEWLIENLAETKWRTGAWIQGFDGGVYTSLSDAAWIALTDAALCAYDDDWNNV